jgi:putative transcriptional regulator
LKNKIKILRKKKKLTQKGLAQKTGLSQAYINELENGKKTNPTYEVLQKIAQALEVPISDILEAKPEGKNTA